MKPLSRVQLTLGQGEFELCGSLIHEFVTKYPFQYCMIWGEVESVHVEPRILKAD